MINLINYIKLIDLYEGHSLVVFTSNKSRKLKTRVGPSYGRNFPSELKSKYYTISLSLIAALVASLLLINIVTLLNLTNNNLNNYVINQAGYIRDTNEPLFCGRILTTSYIITKLLVNSYTLIL